MFHSAKHQAIFYFTSPHFACLRLTQVKAGESERANPLPVGKGAFIYTKPLPLTPLLIKERGTRLIFVILQKLLNATNKCPPPACLRLHKFTLVQKN